MKFWLSFLLFIIILPTLAGNKDNASFPRIIPQPLQVENITGKLRILPVIYLEITDKETNKRVNLFKQMLKDIGYQVVTDSAYKFDCTSLELALVNGLDTLGNEGYKLHIDPTGIKISASQSAGLFYGMQSLVQCLPNSEGKRLTMPCFHISDKPRFRWRGMHLDVCRHFFQVETVKQYIEEMSKLKLNTFHWHLTEDQGWRIEIKRFPRLTEVGSFRKETMIRKNFNPYIGDGIPHGGYYTQEQIKEIISYAAERYITVVPEIEMPGHSLAALAAYPEYSCTGGPFEVATTWGVFDDIFCPREETFRFLEAILDEVMALFPGDYIHIGGDEAPKSRWRQCPHCQARMKEEGLKDEHELQSYFIGRIEKHLHSGGKKLIGWDEILEGGLAPEATVLSWRGVSGGIAAARMQHDVVMAPGFAMYFDHYQGDTAQEPFAIHGYTPLEKVYRYNPVPDSLNAEEQQYILGVQANMWTEYILSPEHLEYMLFPRILALSEIAWTNTGNKDWNNFLFRTESQFRRLKRQGLNFRIPEPIVIMDDSLSNRQYREITLYSPVQGEIHYTLDGSVPGPSSNIYRKPLKIKQGIDSRPTIKAYLESTSQSRSAWKQIYP